MASQQNILGSYDRRTQFLHHSSGSPISSSERDSILAEFQMQRRRMKENENGRSTTEKKEKVIKGELIDLLDTDNELIEAKKEPTDRRCIQVAKQLTDNRFLEVTKSPNTPRRRPVISVARQDSINKDTKFMNEEVASPAAGGGIGPAPIQDSANDSLRKMIETFTQKMDTQTEKIDLMLAAFLKVKKDTDERMDALDVKLNSVNSVFTSVQEEMHETKKGSDDRIDALSTKLDSMSSVLASVQKGMEVFDADLDHGMVNIHKHADEIKEYMANIIHRQKNEEEHHATQHAAIKSLEGTFANDKIERRKLSDKRDKQLKSMSDKIDAYSTVVSNFLGKTIVSYNTEIKQGLDLNRNETKSGIAMLCGRYDTLLAGLRELSKSEKEAAEKQSTTMNSMRTNLAGMISDLNDEVEHQNHELKLTHEKTANLVTSLNMLHKENEKNKQEQASHHDKTLKGLEEVKKQTFAIREVVAKMKVNSAVVPPPVTQDKTEDILTITDKILEEMGRIKGMCENTHSQVKGLNYTINDVVEGQEKMQTKLDAAEAQLGKLPGTLLVEHDNRSGGGSGENRRRNGGGAVGFTPVPSGGR